MRGPELLFGALIGALVALCVHFSRQRQLTYENEPTNSGNSGPGRSWTHSQTEQKGRRNSIDECIICLQAVDANSTTSRQLRCGHIFHYKCLVNWLKEKGMSNAQQNLFPVSFCLRESDPMSMTVRKNHKLSWKKECPLCRKPATQ